MGDMKVVLDTNVIVAGLRSRSGASYQLLRLIQKDQLDYLLSVPLVLEYEDVLKRPQNLEVTQLDISNVEQVLNVLCLRGKEIRIHYLWRPRLSDPKDDMVLELAVNGKADAIVTFNIADFKNQAGAFGIQLLTPGAFLQHLRQNEVMP